MITYIKFEVYDDFYGGLGTRDGKKDFQKLDSARKRRYSIY